LPHAQLHTITHAGHSIWMDEPELFTQSLRRSLRATTSAADASTH
jgi:pimeloyl-ACP methyl ester carboxylesterase